VWIKERGDTGGHVLYDTVRGATKHLASHSTNAEATDTDALTSFNNYGFSLGSGYTVVSVNGSTRTYVGWAWKAGGNSNTFNINDVGYATASAAGLTAGSITPTGASVNTKSGFSIITFTAQSSGNATINHGLGRTPSLILTKSRTQTLGWYIYTNTIGSSGWLQFTTAAAVTGNSAAFGGTDPTSTVFTYGSGLVNTGDIVAYLWAEIPGFSKFGSYTGNGSTDGPMVITGFRTRWLLIKRTDTTSNWFLLDAARNTYNPVNSYLMPNDASAEDPNNSTVNTDFTSNGFKLRATTGAMNASGGTYIYAAFAETPTQNLYGAQANAR
jgi:hypothetical protein